MDCQADGAKCAVPGLVSLQTLSSCNCRLTLSSSSRVPRQSVEKLSKRQSFEQSRSTSTGTAVEISDIAVLEAPPATPSSAADVKCAISVKAGEHAGLGQPSMLHALQHTLHQVTDCTLQLEAFSRQQHAMQVALQAMTTRMQDSVLQMQQQ